MQLTVENKTSGELTFKTQEKDGTYTPWTIPSNGEKKPHIENTTVKITLQKSGLHSPHDLDMAELRKWLKDGNEGWRPLRLTISDKSKILGTWGLNLNIVSINKIFRT